METASVWAEITKSEQQPDGTLLVTGSVSDETLDIDKQIADGEWLKGAVPAWFRTGGNVREMHQPIAAGVATEYAEKGGAHQIVAHVVDPGSVRKVEAGVLKGFSIGIRSPRVVHDKSAAGGRIVGGQIIEVSLVDRPANPSCTLTLAKAAVPGMTVRANDYDDASRLVKVEELHETAAPAVPDAPEPEAVPATVEAEKTVGAVLDEDLTKRDFTAAERARAAKQGKAMPGGGFPILDVRDLENAIHAIGRAKDPAAAKAHIRSRAKALGRSDLIPDTWKSAATTDEHAHDPATLAEVRNGLLQCLIAEAQEALSGENEVYDLQILVDTLAQFLCWWSMETYEGEAPASTDTKSAQAEKEIIVPDEPAKTEGESTITVEDKTANADLLKSVVAQALKDALGDLGARLEKVEAMAAPGGPARLQHKTGAVTSRRADDLRVEIANLRATVAGLDSGPLASEYQRQIVAKTALLESLTLTPTP